MNDRLSHEPRPHASRRRAGTAAALLAVAAALLTAVAGAQQADDDAPALDTLVGPIALYPDDLIGILLPASTYPLQIVEAARFLEALESDPTLEPDADWDDSVVALLNYPDVLRMLDEDLDWTWALGEAVLDEQDAVLDAIQNFRDRAYAAGNLQSDDRQRVNRSEEVIQIASADPEVIYVPYYEPRKVVVYQPAPVIRYYPRPYPVYYYPYATGHSFTAGFFWGVTSVFSVSWHSHYVHVHHHSHHTHPYYRSRHRYNAPYYVRRAVNVNINVNVRDGAHVWQPSYRRAARPHRGRVVNVEQGVRRTYTNRARGREARVTEAGRTRGSNVGGQPAATRRADTNRRPEAARDSDAVIRGLATRRAETRSRAPAADSRADGNTRALGRVDSSRSTTRSSQTTRSNQATRSSQPTRSTARANQDRAPTQSRRPETRANRGTSANGATTTRQPAARSNQSAPTRAGTTTRSRSSLGGVSRSSGGTDSSRTRASTPRNSAGQTQGRATAPGSASRPGSSAGNRASAPRGNASRARSLGGVRR